MGEFLKKVKVLQVVSKMHQGGIENFLMNVYRKIDTDKVQFDFIVHHKERCCFEDEIEKLGGKVYHFSVMDDKNLIKYFFEINKFFKEHKEYNIIHAHLASIGFIYLFFAKKNGVKIRIAHSHGTAHLNNLKGRIKGILFHLFPFFANYYMACSTEAGKFLFPNKTVEIVPNAIEIEKFQFDANIRNDIRNKYNLNDKFVIINVGRLNLQKNHIFLLRVFRKVVDLNKNAILVLIGDGEERHNIENEIINLNLESTVKMLGIQKNVSHFYSASDVFVMPSFWEGLPVTGVEAQVSGLNCIFADTITKEVIVTKQTRFLSLNEKEEKWAEEILNLNPINRNKIKINNNMFDINYLAKYMEEKYIKYNNLK